MPLLPFLKNKKRDAAVIVQERAPDAPQEDSGSSAMEAAAQDILRAISQNDYKHLAMALQSAFDICQSQPQDEAPSLDEEV